MASSANGNKTGSAASPQAWNKLWGVHWGGGGGACALTGAPKYTKTRMMAAYTRDTGLEVLIHERWVPSMPVGGVLFAYTYIYVASNA